MTSPPSPPNRRRRRIVATVAVLLVFGLAWWLWPRVDQRFVGTWTFGGSGTTITFSADGQSAVMQNGSILDHMNETGHWWVSRNVLHFQKMTGNPLMDLWRRAKLEFARMRQTQLPPGFFDFPIAKVEDNLIQLRTEEGRTVRYYTYTRLRR